MKWWERLNRIIEARGLNVADVARDAVVPLKTLYGYLKGEVDNPRGDTVARLAKAVGTTEQALRYGDTHQTAQFKRVLLLDMEKVGILKVGQDPRVAWDGVSTVTVPVDVPEGAFGLSLLDDSGAPEFAAGDIVIYHPNEPAVPGKYAIAILADDQSAHFGLYRPLQPGRNPKRFKIVPPNGDFAEIEIGGKVKGFLLGRVIMHFRRL